MKSTKNYLTTLLLSLAAFATAASASANPATLRPTQAASLTLYVALSDAGAKEQGLAADRSQIDAANVTCIYRVANSADSQCTFRDAGDGSRIVVPTGTAAEALYSALVDAGVEAKDEGSVRVAAARRVGCTLIDDGRHPTRYECVIDL